MRKFSIRGCLIITSVVLNPLTLYPLVHFFFKLTKNEISIQNVTEKDAGLYTCIAENLASSISTESTQVYDGINYFY